MGKHRLALADYDLNTQISFQLILTLRPNKSRRYPLQWGEKENQIFSKANIDKY